MNNLYREAKNKYKICHDDSFYGNYIDDVVSTMFEWDKKIYRAEFFDRILRDCGIGALIKTETSDYTPVFCCPVDLGSGRSADGEFKDAKCFDLTGKQYDFKEWQSNPEILVFFNTPLRNQDLFSDKYASILTDIDMSILNNVLYSRQHPIPVARDKKTKNRIDACIKSVMEGNTETVLMESNIADIIDGVDSVELINITEVEKSQYLQYLSHLHDAVISRLFFLLGLGTTDNGKQAQITVDELNKNDDASVTMALSWFKARKDAIDVAKDKGHDLSFDFSPIWKSRLERIINPPEPVEAIKENEPESEEVEEDEGQSGRED